MFEYPDEPTEQQTGADPEESPGESIPEVIRREVHRSVADALGETMWVLRCGVVATAAGAALTAIGSALLLLGLFRWLDQMLLPPSAPYAIAGALGVIGGIMLCLVGRPRRSAETPVENSEE
jgi:hypothetical protein